MLSKHKAIKRRSGRIHLVLLLFVGIYVASGVSEVRGQRRCKVNLRQVERDIERYRRKETPGIDSKRELIECRETLPLLEKYIVDPDPDLRGLLVDYLSYSHRPSAQVARLLVKQIAAYPSKNRAVDQLYSHFGCPMVRRVRTRPLTNALITRINAADVNPSSTLDKAAEIYLLGCLSPGDASARSFLKSLRTESFPTKLDPELRKSQLSRVNFALAEVNDSAAVAAALAEIDALAAGATPNDVDILIREGVQRTDNCVLLNRFASFINDKREGPTIYLGDGVKTLRIRYGDIAVLAFTNRFGARVTGYEYKNDESQRHDEAELDQIYQRVKKYLGKQCGQNSTISSANAVK